MKHGTRGALALGMLTLVGILLCGSAPPAAALSLDDVIRLQLAGVSEETILHVVEAEDAVFILSVDDIIDLKQAGASDEFIRALMKTADGYASEPAYREEYHDYRDFDDYYDTYDPYGFDDYTIIFTNYYYDPFAYHWYAWPRFYVYYSPFWWFRTGAYYAGYWCRDWWDPWSSCVWYCDLHYGYSHYFGPSRTRVRAGRTWHRLRDASAQRVDRERRIARRAGLADPPTPETHARTVGIRGSRITPGQTGLRRGDSGSITRSRDVRSDRTTSRVRTGGRVLREEPANSRVSGSATRARKPSTSKQIEKRTSRSQDSSTSTRTRSSKSPTYRRGRTSSAAPAPGNRSVKPARSSPSRSAVSSHRSSKPSPSRTRQR